MAGHTRYKAAEKLGLKAVPVVIADDLTDEQIKGYRIADNKVSDYSIWDNKTLLDELAELGDDVFTGFIQSEDFDDVLDEGDSDVLRDNQAGVTYEVVFRSEDPQKIDDVVSFWEAMPDE